MLAYATQLGEDYCMAEIPKPEIVGSKYRDRITTTSILGDGGILRLGIEYDIDDESLPFYDKLKQRGLQVDSKLAWVEFSRYMQITVRHPTEVMAEEDIVGLHPGREVTHTLEPYGLTVPDTRYVVGVQDDEYKFQTREEILAAKALTNHMAEWLTRLTTSTQQDADRDFGLEEFIKLIPDA